jgi:hypothetical protein
MKMTVEMRAAFAEMGRIGGANRAKNLTPRQRKRAARKAAKVRWANRKVSA